MDSSIQMRRDKGDDSLMPKYHIIVDVYYMYYRYKYLLEGEKFKRLSTVISGDFLGLYNRLRAVYGMEESNGNIDVSGFYYPIRAIEAELQKYVNSEDEVSISICFDSKTIRHESEDANGYKANRTNKLTVTDHFNISMMEMLFRLIGYHVYKEDGYEADDLIFSLVKKYHKEFNKTLIYTPDADVLVNLADDVTIYRYKTSERKHIAYTKDNFESLMTKEYKCQMPYNVIILYKSLCGDKSDNISGVKGFGPKSFDKFINILREDGIDFSSLLDYQVVENLLYDYKDNLFPKNQNGLTEALSSLELVKAIYNQEIKFPDILSKDAIYNNRNTIYRYKLNFNL